MNTNETMYHGIKQASKAMKLSIDFLRRARAHPDCPNSTEGGFAKSGRIYATKDFLNWLEEHKEELNTVTPETIEWWDTLRIKYQTLALELELEERRKKVVNKKDAIDTMQRMRQAYNQLMQSKLVSSAEIMG